LLSSDSPLMSPIFAKMSDAMTKLLSYDAFPVMDVLNNQLAFADGSLDTNRSDTVNPSS
jgi:hypothetical protein